MNLVLRFLSLMALLCLSVNAFAQPSEVTGVKYHMQYNQDSCWYDCYIIISEGSATNAILRTQFNAQYTVIAPTGY